MEESLPMSPPSTSLSKNFRESTHLIPTPIKPKRYEPPQLKLSVIAPASLLMIGLGIGLEVALSISNRHNGFHVPEKNVFKFASEQFLTSFVPILFVLPLGLLWQSKAWHIRRYQPYVNIARGNAKAEHSIILDYIFMSPLVTVFASFSNRHFLVFIATSMSLLCLLLQPLAGSIFDIEQVPELSPTITVNSLRTLGLDPDRAQLNSFLSSSGYVQAAVSNNLPDPPFIKSNWATADFVFPIGYLNGTIDVNTTGIRTNATCSAPTALNLDTSNAANFSISATSSSNCSAHVTFPPDSATQQYGSTAVPNCGPHASLNETFFPVFFWFFHTNDFTNQPQAAGVFCAPTLEVCNVTARADLNSGALLQANITGFITSQDNNVTGPPQNGVPFNGVIFPPSTDTFVQARSTATANEVPNAILRSVLQGNESNIAFNNLDGFVNQASIIYTQFLALVAKNTYLLPTNEPLPGIPTSLKPRLTIESLPAHFLSAILIIVGSVMLVVGIIHRSIRKNVFLAAPTGNIASAIALTSHSGFGEALVPYDTQADVAAKLSAWRFSFDPRTGAIIAHGEGDYADRPESPVTRNSSGASKFKASLMSRLGSLRSTEKEADASLAGPTDHSHALATAGYQVSPYTPPAELDREREPLV